MPDESKLPKWAQEELRRVRNALEQAELKAERANTRAEKLSGQCQEAIDCLRQCAEEGCETAKIAVDNYMHGAPLRAGKGDY